MIRRLSAFAVFFGWPPREVWALTADEWVVLSAQVDQMLAEHQGR